MQVGKVNGSADVVTAAHSVVPVETLLDLHAYDGESERPDKFEEKGYLVRFIILLPRARKEYFYI